MADWQGMARSNYFAVKDAGAFAAWLATIDGITVEPSDNDESRFMVWSAEGWPSSRNDEDDIIDIDFVDELLDQVAHGEVVLLIEANHDKARFVGGTALALRAGHDGMIKLSLDDIHELAAAQWPGAVITRAER